MCSSLCLLIVDPEIHVRDTIYRCVKYTATPAVLCVSKIHRKRRIVDMGLFDRTLCEAL